ncbi:MAG: hypothetical protein ACR2NL_07055, partial [Acidimicrobiia bacterium]
MSRYAMIAAWVLVTGATTFLAWQIVAAADATVSDRPLSVVAATQAASPDQAEESSTTSTQAPLPVAT